MTAKTSLRAVEAGEKAPKTSPRTVAAAAQDGTTRELLVAMRARIAKTVTDDDCPPVALAALSKRIEDLTDKIIAIDARAQQEASDGADAEDEAFDAEAI